MLAIALGALAFAGVAVAEGKPEPAWRTTLTPGATLHFPSQRFGPSDTSSWRDQYEFLAHPSDAPPWHLDFLAADLGLQRSDETWLLHLERTAPFAYGERTRFDLDWLGLRIAGEAFRIRTDELRWFPIGTEETGPTAGTRLGMRFNDDSDPDDRFYVRRWGGGGEIRLCPADFDRNAGPLTQLALRGRQEVRTGRRQDRFLLSAGEVGAGPDTARFRGRTRELDQEVTTVGARLVTEPFALATSVLDYEFERFHESAETALVGDIDAPGVLPNPLAAERALFYVPDTQRHTGSIRISRTIGGAALHAGAFASHLAQTGARPPLQRAAGLRDDDVTTASAHAAADVPLTRWLTLDAYGKAALRHNGLDRSTPFFGDDNRTQIYPFSRALTDVRSGAELIASPMRGASIAAGWRMRDVNRDLKYPALVAADGIAQRAIYPAVSLVREDSAQHEGYVRGHVRLLARTRIAGEAGYAWAPAIGSPTELEQAVFAEGRITHGIARPIALTVSLFGHYRDGESDGFELSSTFAGRSQTKDYERRSADWGLSLAATPRRGTTVFLSVSQQLDRQRFPHVRTNVPRPNGAAFVRFVRDSELGFESDARILALGGTQQVTRRIDFSLMGWLGFVDGRFPRGGSTADALEAANQIDLTYGSAEAAIGVQVLPALRLGLAYRYDAYEDDARLDEPNRDGHDHALTLSATYEFTAAGGD